MQTNQNFQWHFYDQGLLNRLAVNFSEKQTNDFMESLSKELGINLFDYGFKAVHTPFAFLEAIGITSFPGAIDSVKSKIISNYRREDFLKDDFDFPSIVLNECGKFFTENATVGLEALGNRSNIQVEYSSNRVVFELLRHIIRDSVDSLDDDAIKYHQTVCTALAVEYAQMFPYYEVLANLHVSYKIRHEKTSKIYFDFLKGSQHIVFDNRYNISLFRSFDCARKQFAEWEDRACKHNKIIFKDPYQNFRLRSGSDFLDSYFIHFAVCGFYFEPCVNPVCCFTIDDPATILARVIFAKQTLHHFGRDAKSMIPGIIYCFDKNTLALIEKINVSEVPMAPLIESSIAPWFFKYQPK